MNSPMWKTMEIQQEETWAKEQSRQFKETGDLNVSRGTVLVINTTSKSYPRRKGLISSSGSLPIIKRSQAGTQGRSLEARGPRRSTSYWLTLPSSDLLSYLS